MWQFLACCIWPFFQACRLTTSSCCVLTNQCGMTISTMGPSGVTIIPMDYYYFIKDFVVWLFYLCCMTLSYGENLNKWYKLNDWNMNLCDLTFSYWWRVYFVSITGVSITPMLYMYACVYILPPFKNVIWLFNSCCISLIHVIIPFHPYGIIISFMGI